MKKGFTLVELSIVLIIIGLLIGGILVARSMVTTTRIQSLVRQIGQFDAAVTLFQSNYKQLPGDNSIVNTDCPGDSDGFIVQDPSGYSLAAYNSFNFDGEIGAFWSDLAKVGLKSDKGTGYSENCIYSSDITDVSTYMPKAVAGHDAYFIGYATDTGYGPANYYYIGGAAISSGSDTVTPTPAFTPVDVLALDKKIDDGVANTGNVQGSDDPQQALPNISAFGITDNMDIYGVGVCVTAAAGGTYAVDNNQESCSILVKIGTMNGTSN